MISRDIFVGLIASLFALLAPAGEAFAVDQVNGATLMADEVHSDSISFLSQDAATEDELLDEGKHKITFDPFHLSILRRGRVKATVDLQLVLQLHDNKDYEALNEMKPQLRADITAALSTLARQRWRITRPIDPDIVSAYLTPFVEHRAGVGRLNVYVLHALINPT